MKQLLQKLPPWTLTIVCSAAILYLTLMPEPLPDGTPMLFPGADKLVHAIMFGGLTYCILVDYRRRRRNNNSKVSTKIRVTAAIASTAAGAAIELAQILTGAGRSGDLLDLLADAAGAFIAAFLPIF